MKVRPAMNDYDEINSVDLISILSGRKEALKDLLKVFSELDDPTIRWGGGKQADGVSHMPFPVYHPAVNEFWECINPLISSFNYRTWPEFKNKQYIEASFYENASLEDISRGITAISRGERFVDGYWGSVFKPNGPIKTILMRILYLIGN